MVDRRDITLPELEEVLRSINGESWVLVDENAQVIYGVGPVGGVVGHGAREGTHIAEYVHPDDLPRALDAMSRVLATPDVPITERMRVMHGDGTWRLFDVTAVNRLADEDVRAVVVRSVEVHDELAQHGDDLVGSLAEAVPTPILVVDHVGNVLFTNSAARSLLGEDVDRITAELRTARAAGSARVTFEHRTRWIHARIADQSEGWVAMLDDITVQRDTEEQLYRLAMTDQLTDVANRTAFDRKLAQVLEVAGDAPVSVVFVDLDGFKRVNDTYGHAAGDKVLQVVAARLKKEVRPGDTVARIGGDEFGIICEGLTAEDAPGFAERMADAVRERIAIGDGRVLIGASAGSATTPPAPRDAAALLAAADRAMYRDKTIETWAPTIEL